MRQIYFLVQFSSPFCKFLALKLQYVDPRSRLNQRWYIRPIGIRSPCPELLFKYFFSRADIMPWLIKCLNFIKGPSIKDVYTKSRKIDPYPCPHWLNPSPLSVRTHHKFEKSEVFLRKKVRTSASEESPPPLSTKCPHWTNSLPPDWGRLLWTAPNTTYRNRKICLRHHDQHIIVLLHCIH